MTCSKLDNCHKVKTVLDKSFDAPELYQQVVKVICAKCAERSE